MKVIYITLLLLSLSLGNCLAQSLKYVGSTPATGSDVKDFKEVVLEFDLTDVISTYGEGDWAICNQSGKKTSRKPARYATLYKGDADTGEQIEQQAINIGPLYNNYVVGNTYSISFPDVEVESGQQYSLVVSYEFYAYKVGDASWTTGSLLNLGSDPLVLTFYGASEPSKVLKYVGSDIDGSVKYEHIPAVKFTFNHNVAVNDGAQATVSEGGTALATSTSVQVDPADPKTVIATFSEEADLYNGHNYTCVLPAGAVSLADDASVTSTEASVTFEGAQFRSFGTGRISPAQNSVTLMDYIAVPFNFPVIDGSNYSYGFVYVKDIKYPMKVYKGEESDTPIDTVYGYPDNNSLIFGVKCDLDADQDYTLVIEEGTVKAYAIGAPNYAYLKDYISEKVVLHYRTPAVEDLPKLVLSDCRTADGAYLKHIDEVDWWPASYYSYNNREYQPGYKVDDATSQGILYRITDSGEEEVKRVPLTAWSNTRVTAKVNADLYDGCRYRLVIPQGTLSIGNNAFLKKYVSNEEASIYLNGTKEESVALSYTVNGLSEMTTTVTKGSVITLALHPTDGWKVQTLTLNGESVGDVTDNTYTTPALTADATVAVEYAYDGDLQFIDLATAIGAVALDGSAYSVSQNGDYLVISGLAEGDNVTVYNTGGMKLADHVASADSLKLQVPTGVYIIRVGLVTFKVQK